MGVNQLWNNQCFCQPAATFAGLRAGALVSNRGQIWLLYPNSSMQRLLTQGGVNCVCSTPMKLLCFYFFNHFRFSGSGVTEIHHYISCHIYITLKKSI